MNKGILIWRTGAGKIHREDIGLIVLAEKEAGGNTAGDGLSAVLRC